MGAGGFGGFFGGKLAKAGQDVWFIARGKQLAALKTDGLRLQGPDLRAAGRRRPPPPPPLPGPFQIHR